MDIIGSILSKISSYNILNYMIPGAVGFIVTDKLLGYCAVETWPAYIICIAIYFIGMVFNRIGSLIIEPWYHSWKIVEYAKYEDYVVEESKDSKITALSEVNNAYKTYSAEFLTFFIFLIAMDIYNRINLISDILRLIFTLGLYVLFSYSYHKQTTYIRKRVAEVIAKK